MSTQYHIQLIDSSKVDVEKWDEVITQSNHGLIYAYTFYLNALCKNWKAIIVNNYEAVMPLPYRIKWGITYLYHPPFTQQLGLVGKWDTNTLIKVNEIIQQNFTYGDILWNEANFATESIEAIAKQNYLLQLPTTIQYSKDFQKNLKKAQNNPFQIQDGNTNILVDLYYQEYGTMMGLHLSACESFKHLLSQLTLHSKCSIYSKSILFEGECVGGLIWLKDKHRYYNIINVTTNKGKQLRANHYLWYNVLESVKEENITLDFEGSDLIGVASFYENFHPQKKYYGMAHFNRLPFFIRWMKR